MNYLDIFILIVLIWFGWIGFKKGLILEVFTFLALFLGLYAGINFSDLISSILTDYLGMTSEYIPVISFLVIFLAVGAMVYFGGKALEKVVKVVRLTPFNKLAGLFFGSAKGLFLLGAVIILTESFDERNDIIETETKEESLLYLPLKNTTTTCIPAFEESTIFLKNSLKENDTIINPEVEE